MEESGTLFGHQCDDSQFAVCVAGRDESLANFVEVANTFFTRLCGLQFRLPLRRGHGLLLYPAASIHSFWMRGAIDVLWLDKTGKVLRVCHAVQPWRMRTAPTGTFAVLELGVGTAIHIADGDVLEKSVATTHPAEPGLITLARTKPCEY